MVLPTLPILKEFPAIAATPVPMRPQNPAVTTGAAREQYSDRLLVYRIETFGRQ